VGFSIQFAIQPANCMSDSIVAIRDVWNRTVRYHSEWMAEEIADCMQKHPDDSSRYGAAMDRRKELIDNYVTGPIFDELCRVFRQDMSDREQWLLELGLVLDQGVRRPDVYRFMETPPPPGAPFIISPKPPEVLNYDPPKSLESYCRQDKIRIRLIVPGELAPDTAWPDTLNQLLEKVGMRGAADECIRRIRTRQEPREWIRLVWQALDETDQTIRSRLDSEETCKEEIAPTNDALKSTEGERPIIQITAMSATITWKSVCYRVSTETAEAFQKMLESKDLLPVGVGSGKPLRKPAKWLKDLKQEFPDLAALVVREGNKGYRLKFD
jgi:hypothetical protein